MNAITSNEGEANVIANIRQDWRNLHSHPWIDDANGSRRRAIRRYIRGAVARVRTYRATRRSGGLLATAEQLQKLAFQLSKARGGARK